MVIAVFSEKDLDCVVKEREYYLFDTGMAVGFLILRATELGLVAHPIAGYDEARVKEILGIRDSQKLITLLIVGKISDGIGPELTEKQVDVEQQRPQRLNFEEFAQLRRYLQGPSLPRRDCGG